MKVVNEIKAFRASKMNLDVAAVMAEPMDTGEVLNMIEEAQSGRLTNLKGVESVSSMAVNSDFAWPAGTNTCVGSCYDVESSELLFAIANARGTHSILSMNIDTYELVWVLQDELLNFKTDHPVSMDVVSGLLYFTDGYFNSFLSNDFNPPRKINIAKAKKYTEAVNGSQHWEFTHVQEAYAATKIKDYQGMTAYYSTTVPYPYTVAIGVVAFSRDGINRIKSTSGHSDIMDLITNGGRYIVVTNRPWTDEGLLPIERMGHILPYDTGMYFGIDWQVLDRIKYPPSLSPDVTYGNDSTVKSNNLRNNLFQFAYRYIYDDNEKSVFSPYSDVITPTSLEGVNGALDDDPEIDNMIVGVIDSGSSEIKAIEVVVRNGNTGTWGIFEKIDKYDRSGNVIISSDLSINYSFYNSEVTTPIDQVDVFRPFDAVPLTSLSQSIIEKNRVIDANYIEGFDNIDVDVDLSVTSNEVIVGRIGGALTTGEIRQWVGFPYSVYNFGMQYYGSKIQFDNFYEPGFTYIVKLSALPAIYDDGENLGGQVFFEYFMSKINATAFVVADENMSIGDFLDTVVLQLRNGTSFGKILALNNHSYKTFGWYDYVYDFDYAAGSPLMTNTELGFIFQWAGNTVSGGWNPCTVCQYVDIDILKVSSTAVYSSFKSGAFHDFGIVYKDRAGRRSFVNKSSDTRIFVPSIKERINSEIVKNEIGWKINHVPPVEAVSYQWVYAGNTSVSYFLFASIQGITNLPRGNVIAINNTSIFINEYIVETHEYLSKFNVPAYQWERGDRMRFIFKRNQNNYYKTFDSSLDFEIIGVYYPGGDDGYEKDTATTPSAIVDANGNKVRTIRGVALIVSKFDYESYDISADNVIIEVYRPKKSSDSLIYYDFGQSYPILNPHTAIRSHGGDTVNQEVNGSGVQVVPAQGVFDSGDVFVAFRIMHNMFPCERYSFSDFFDSESYWKGIQNAVNVSAKNTLYKSKLIYSGRLIQDTLVNDLSRVDSSDSIALPDKYGSINSMMEVGDILKVIQQSKTSSLYIGRAGVTQPNEEGSQIISSTKDVLGTLMLSKGSAGTVHPMSVTKSATQLYWFDFHAAAIYRDSGNGAQNLSDDYNLKSFIASACDTWGSPDNVAVISAWDERSGVVWFTFIGTGLSFTVGFREARGKNSDGFVLFASFIPEFYGIAKNTLTSFRSGDLWLHGSDNVPRCNFYGVQYGYYVDVLLNQFPANIKRFKQLKVATNLPVECSEITIEPNGNYPLGMSSILKAAAFTSVQGKRVASFGRNMLTTGVTPSYDDLINGDELEGTAMTVKVRGGSTDEHWITTIEAEEIVYE